MTEHEQLNSPERINDFAARVVHHALDHDERERKRLGIGPLTERVAEFDQATLEVLGIAFGDLIPLLETHFRRNGRCVRFVYVESLTTPKENEHGLSS